MLAQGAGAVLDRRAVPPVPVATNAPTARRPGDQRAPRAVPRRRGADRDAARSTRTATLAAHLLGYTGEVTAADKKANKTLNDADTIGRQRARGAVRRARCAASTARRSSQLNPQGYTVGAGATVAADAGRHPGDQHRRSTCRSWPSSRSRSRSSDSRKAGKPATGGAVVVMDPEHRPHHRRGQLPDLQPAAVHRRHLQRRLPRADRPGGRTTPLLNRAIAGAVRTGLDVQADHVVVAGHAPRDQRCTTPYRCPGSLTIDGRVKTNYDSEVLGADHPARTRSATRATRSSTRPTADEYYADQARIDASGKKPHEYLQRMAAAYGVGTHAGRRPAGRRAGQRQLRRPRDPAGALEGQQGRVLRRRPKRGYPDDHERRPTAPTSPSWPRRTAPTAGATAPATTPTCRSGRARRRCRRCSSRSPTRRMVNGGKIWEPTLGWGVVDAHGKVVRTIEPKVRNTVPVEPEAVQLHRQLADFSRGWAVSGAFAYIGSPYQNQHRRQDRHGRGRTASRTRPGWRPGGRRTRQQRQRQGQVRHGRHGRAGRHRRHRRRPDAQAHLGRAVRRRRQAADHRRRRSPETTLPKVAPQVHGDRAGDALRRAAIRARAVRR